MKPATLAFAALITLPAAGFAQDMADSDGDGMVTIEELVAAYPDVASAELFATLDADGSGALDTDELAAAQQAGLLPMDDM